MKKKLGTVVCSCNSKQREANGESQSSETPCLPPQKNKEWVGNNILRNSTVLSTHVKFTTICNSRPKEGIVSGLPVTAARMYPHTHMHIPTQR